MVVSAQKTELEHEKQNAELTQVAAVRVEHESVKQTQNGVMTSREPARS